MELIRKVILVTIALIMDIAFIYIILKTKHATIDRYYIFSVLLIHIFFIFGILFNNNTIIDGCHILYVFAIMILTLLCVNNNILTIILILLLMQKILRTIFGECIMFTSEDHFIKGLFKGLFKDLFVSFIYRNIKIIEYILIGIILYKLSMN